MLQSACAGVKSIGPSPCSAAAGSAQVGCGAAVPADSPRGDGSGAQ